MIQCQAQYICMMRFGCIRSINCDMCITGLHGRILHTTCRIEYRTILSIQYDLTKLYATKSYVTKSYVTKYDEIFMGSEGCFIRISIDQELIL